EPASLTLSPVCLKHVTGYRRADLRKGCSLRLSEQLDPARRPVLIRKQIDEPEASSCLRQRRNGELDPWIVREMRTGLVGLVLHRNYGLGKELRGKGLRGILEQNRKKDIAGCADFFGKGPVKFLRVFVRFEEQDVKDN